MSATGSSSRPIRPTSRRRRVATLDRQVQWLQQYPRYTFTIEGHADERGTREYNIALGARRATAVQRLSSSRAASPPNRMRTISYGKERPVAVCDDISCWSQNRRAVTVLNNAGVVIGVEPRRLVSEAAARRRAVSLFAPNFGRTRPSYATECECAEAVGGGSDAPRRTMRQGRRDTMND